ncbi:hypothetical protein R80B4_00767 [Fibrobacteres bacterium R8-0-B4]
MKFRKRLKWHLMYWLRWTRLTKKSRNAYKSVDAYVRSIAEFKKAFYQYSYISFEYANKFINAYLNKSVKQIKILQSALNKNDPIMLGAVKNDLERVKLQVEYHRNIGIKHFAYIDNMSTDGTFEWLKEQPDVSLFLTEETFNAEVKDAWKRQVTDILGYDRWYLALDSDEFFIYPGIETRKITEYIDFLENNKIGSAFSIMIDMYSCGRLFENGNEADGIFDSYRYFDTNTYTQRELVSKHLIVGGPRMRLFSALETVNLEKYPLVKLSKDMLMATHQNFPYKHNFETKGAIAFLLHYKFLPGDIELYKERITSGLYYNGSQYYKDFINAFEQNPNLSFYYEGSQKLNDSMDLMKINPIDRNFFERFGAVHE